MRATGCGTDHRPSRRSRADARGPRARCGRPAWRPRAALRGSALPLASPPSLPSGAWRRVCGRAERRVGRGGEQRAGCRGWRGRSLRWRSGTTSRSWRPSHGSARTRAALNSASTASRTPRARTAPLATRTPIRAVKCEERRVCTRAAPRGRRRTRPPLCPHRAVHTCRLFTLTHHSIQSFSYH
ncbi:hypothetical protein EMIHUDRAFT_439893, partial [Emiliania huxleyi CCMP1516]|uniref:Uncharacterized protein n=2 Tax=Emiliania huxleyi TaxID=2903 RepID=A0A0D3KTV9_EMIH1